MKTKKTDSEFTITFDKKEIRLLKDLLGRYLDVYLEEGENDEVDSFAEHLDGVLK